MAWNAISALCWDWSRGIMWPLYKHASLPWANQRGPMGEGFRTLGWLGSQICPMRTRPTLLATFLPCVGIGTGASCDKPHCPRPIREGFRAQGWHQKPRLTNEHLPHPPSNRSSLKPFCLNRHISELSKRTWRLMPPSSKSMEPTTDTALKMWPRKPFEMAMESVWSFPEKMSDLEIYQAPVDDFDVNMRAEDENMDWTCCGKTSPKFEGKLNSGWYRFVHV